MFWLKWILIVDQFFTRIARKQKFLFLLQAKYDRFLNLHRYKNLTISRERVFDIYCGIIYNLIVVTIFCRKCNFLILDIFISVVYTIEYYELFFRIEMEKQNQSYY